MLRGESDEEEKSPASSDAGACEDAVAGFSLKQQAAAKEREGGEETSEAPSQRAKRDQLVAEESCDSKDDQDDADLAQLIPAEALLERSGLSGGLPC